MTEIDFALTQNNPKDQIELVGTVLWNKADKIGSFKKLSLPERNFIYIDIFESEINHGGLFHFFYNTSGEFSHEVLEAFEAINATQSASILNEAVKIFPELPVPKDIINRRFYMNNLEESILLKWDQLETKLTDSKEDIISLLLYYIKCNKSVFEY
jgi:hypothetical protein